jgi:hypothetical protein
MKSVAIERLSATIDYSGGNTLSGLKTTISSIEARITRTRKRMKTIRIILSNQNSMDFKLLEEYQSLNEDVRGLEIFKAEFKYNKRML